MDQEQKNQRNKKIAELYLNGTKIKDIAAQLRIHKNTVMKALNSEGLWESKSSKKIRELIDQGLSTIEIAEKLHYDEKTVQTYSPYTKGCYDKEHKSRNAISCQEYRERKSHAVNTTNHRDGDIVVSHEECSEDRVRIKCGEGPQTFLPVALKLHIKIKTGVLSDKEKQILRKYGKMKNEISRDVVIPADMTLNALHFMIQALFGWRDKFPHHFSFPNSVFNKITKGKLTEWGRLCGVYFRFPVTKDVYWNNDYDGTKTFKAWLRGKYSEPYFYGALGDYYHECQNGIILLKNQLVKSGALSRMQAWDLDEITIKDFLSHMKMEHDMNYLLERLSVKDYLYLPNGCSDWFAEPIDEFLEYLEDGARDEQVIWNYCVQNLKSNYPEFHRRVAASTIRMKPQADELIYTYGNWRVSITCDNSYYIKEIPIAIDQMEFLRKIKYEPLTIYDAYRTVQNEYSNEVIRQVCGKTGRATPVCDKMDGIDVFDDKGGIHSYIQFLDDIHNDKDRPEVIEKKEYAKKCGWSGRTKLSSRKL